MTMRKKSPAPRTRLRSAPQGLLSKSLPKNCAKRKLSKTHWRNDSENWKTEVSPVCTWSMSWQKVFDMPTRQRFLFTLREDSKSRPLLPVDTCTAFRFFFLKSDLKIQLFLCYSIRWQCFTFSEERIKNIRHADSTAFPFFTRRGDWEKIQTSSASQRVFGISILFPKKEWIENSALLLPLDTLTVVSLSEERSEHPALPGFFALRFADRLLFPQSGWKDPALYNFSRYSKRRQCLLFCDSTRIFMWSVPCLWLSHFVPCALVCVCVCVCQTLYLREINTFLQTDSPTRSSACPYNNSKTGGRSTLTSLLPTKTLVKRWWSWDWSSQCTCFFKFFPAFSNLFQNVSRE